MCNNKLCFFSKHWLDVSVPNHIHIPASLFFIDFYFIQLIILFQISKNNKIISNHPYPIVFYMNGTLLQRYKTC